MKKNTLIITASIYLLIVSNAMIAQCPSCDVALQRDTRNYFQTELKTDFRSLLTEIFSYEWSYYRSGQWKTNTNFQSGGSYGIISGFLDGSKTDEANEQTFNTMKTAYSTTQDISSSVYQKVSQSFQSSEIYKSWVDCIKACPSFDSPILTQTLSGKELTITLYWQHNNTNDEQKIRDITFGNVDSLKGGSMYVTQKVKGRNSYSKKFRIIDIHEPSYVTVTISEYPPANIIIPAVPTENLASNYPIGTIISSVLDWKRFCQINGQPETLNYSDKRRCKWSPADGRSVVGSTYGQLENFVPDLRGVFLRGLNNFEVLGTLPVNPQQADPDLDILGRTRVANSLQKDAFKKHAHGYRYPGGVTNAAAGNARTEISASSDLKSSIEGESPNETRPTNKAVYYYIKIN